MKNDITNICWAKAPKEKRGRDQLGIQNCSIVVYGIQLPGLTNLTNHIRYYGLYCWLIGILSQDKEKTDKYQYNYIRRAELVIALLMRDKGIKGVVGSDYVKKGKCPVVNNSTYDIAAGADYENKETYWKYRTGAFGQYYLGSLLTLGLVSYDDNTFNETDRGRKLAKRFADSVGETACGNFLSVIESGRLSEEDIVELQVFCLNNILVNSSEWNFYKEILIDYDSIYSGTNAYNRRNTLRLLIEFLQENESNNVVNDFVAKMFNEQPSDNSKTEFGWYYYYLIETIHYCLETLFWKFLKGIERKSGIIVAAEYLNEYVESIVKQMKKTGREYFCDIVADNRLGVVDIVKDRCFLDKMIQNGMSDEKINEASAIAIKLLCATFNEYLSRKDLIVNYEKELSLCRQFGNASRLLDICVQKNFTLSLQEALSKIIRRIMKEHTLSSYRKIGNSSASSLKYVIEEGCFIHVETVFPQFTSPRLYSLKNFMEDLSLVSDNKLTNLGMKIF
ncbi:MAG: hypothetical protein J6W06_04870 [Bacteroidales bacterium]|nr:hypothetical protein [Bacteroidales bacterium]